MQAADVGYAVLPDGRGSANVESVVYTDAMGFDRKRSLEAFKTTVSFALVLQDLDVAANGPEGVLHWLAWNIPVKAGGIPEGSLPEGAVVGTAGVGRGNYFGPGAPAGPRYHHYVFELYALSATLNLPADATRAQLLDAMKDIIVGKAAYVGRFRQ